MKYLAPISDVLRACLRHISNVSQAYLRQMSDIYQTYLRHNSDASWAYLRHIMGMSKDYPKNISSISQTYIRHSESQRWKIKNIPILFGWIFSSLSLAYLRFLAMSSIITNMKINWFFFHVTFTWDGAFMFNPRSSSIVQELANIS